MKALTLLVLTATLLLSAGCAGELPLDNGDGSLDLQGKTDAGSDQSGSGSTSGRCSGNIALAFCKAVPEAN